MVSKKEHVLKVIENFAGPYLKKVYSLANKGSYKVISKTLAKLSKLKFLEKTIAGKVIMRFVANAQKRINANQNVAFPVLVALAYFVIPTDVMADFIPIAGYVDDAYVMMLVMSLFK
jgi:uncharacterized membrane protein YkvA (DUF1232 family)